MNSRLGVESWLPLAILQCARRFGFEKSDNTATASIVLRWKAATSAPAP
jgi:hypothetical protein